MIARRNVAYGRKLFRGRSVHAELERAASLAQHERDAVLVSVARQ